MKKQELDEYHGDVHYKYLNNILSLLLISFG